MPRKQEINDKTQEILVLLSAGLSYQETAKVCDVSRMWVYAIAKREMKRLGTDDTTELLRRFCELQIQRAQELRITAERLIQMAESIESRNHRLLEQSRASQSHHLETEDTLPTRTA